MGLGNNKNSIKEKLNVYGVVYDFVYFVLSVFFSLSLLFSYNFAIIFLFYYFVNLYKANACYFHIKINDSAVNINTCQCKRINVEWKITKFYHSKIHRKLMQHRNSYSLCYYQFWCCLVFYYKSNKVCMSDVFFQSCETRTIEIWCRHILFYFWQSRL